MNKPLFRFDLFPILYRRTGFFIDFNHIFEICNLLFSFKIYFCT